MSKMLLLPVKFLFILLMPASISAVAQPPGKTQKTTPRFTYKIIPAPGNTFGYDLIVDGKLKIHQPSRPAMPGNEGFKTKAATERVALLAIKKMKRGESLPTISIDEMKKLQVL